ncbi:hypothetical protein RR48_13522 [Papilio machaon]|uniref:Uncharacterized protein n=1 Tax=Papilio machaon TaxID=76193 RepID=A0A194REU3_PAPMA|nr:hypothetical protein RR48_13522 [Papilio machaon]
MRPGPAPAPRLASSAFDVTPKFIGGQLITSFLAIEGDGVGSNTGSPKYAQIPQMNEAISAPPQQVPLMYCGMVSPQPSFCNVSDMSASASGDDYEYTGGSGDGYQRSAKRSYHGSSSGGTASTPSYHPYRR